MKTLHWMFMALAMSAATGCSITEEFEPTTVPEKKVTFNPSIESPSTVSAQQLTKAPQLSGTGSGDFADGDSFTLLTSTTSGESATYDYRIGFSSLYWKDIPRNSQDQTIDFAACYPVQKIVDGKFSFDLQTAADKDLLWAHTNGVPLMSESPVNLSFKHAMHRLVINYEVVSATLANDPIQTVCTALSSCEVDLAAGALDISASHEASFTAEGSQAVFLLVPQQTANVSLKISFGQNVQEKQLSELAAKYISLEGGKQLNVNLKIKDGSILIDGVSIAGWGNQGTVEGEIIM